MKQEKIFEALSNIGDDLLLMAQNKRFVNPWKRWGKIAACLAVVLCLTMLALPYFPIGCGAAEESTATTESAPQEAMAEETVEEALDECAPAEAPEEEKGQSSTETITVWSQDVAYELQPGVKSIPEDLGEELGVVEQSDGRNLDGCKVFGVLESEDIYVEVPEGYLRGVRTER